MTTVPVKRNSNVGTARSPAYQRPVGPTSSASAPSAPMAVTAIEMPCATSGST